MLKVPTCIGPRVLARGTPVRPARPVYGVLVLLCAVSAPKVATWRCSRMRFPTIADGAAHGVHRPLSPATLHRWLVEKANAPRNQASWAPSAHRRCRPGRSYAGGIAPDNRHVLNPPL